MIADVYAGKVDPRIAACLAPLLNLQLRAITITELANIEKRLVELEKHLKGAEDPLEATASPLETVGVTEVIEEVRQKAIEEWDKSQASAVLSQSANQVGDGRESK